MRLGRVLFSAAKRPYPQSYGVERGAGPSASVVTAEVADPADRPQFDRWYNEEHLRDALATFRADRAWRSWSPRTPLPSEFPDLS